MFGIEIIVWTVIFAFEFLEICAFPSYLLMFYAAEPGPAHTSAAVSPDRKPGRDQGVRGYVTS